MHTEEEHKRLLHKIAFLEDELNAARGSMQNLQSIILSNISHDVRTPMNAIVGFANLLTDEHMDSNDRNECIDQINLNSIELLEIIDNMIDASLLQCGDLKLYEKEFHLNDLMDDLYMSSKELLNARQKDLSLIVSKGEKNDFNLIADIKRLRQILINLINNAINFTPAGRIEFGYEKVRCNIIRFFVKDTGIGLGSVASEDLFKPFRPRVISENSSFKKGAGLGLALSNNLVNLMGGEMWADSVPDGGTCFYFTLPARRNSFLKNNLQQISKITKRNIASFF
jgi:signal transduction histidine kinase